MFYYYKQLNYQTDLSHCISLANFAIKNNNSSENFKKIIIQQKNSMFY